MRRFFTFSRFSVLSRISRVSRFSTGLLSTEASQRAALLGALAALSFSAVGCTPNIGDKCALSTDCSIRGDRLCDTSQPGGYCTIFNCRTDSCPDKAACVLFQAGVQGCGYDDRTFSRTGRTFCMAQCHSDSDCRDGYMCTDPRQPPWSALIIDDDQSQRVCIVRPDDGVVGPNASVATVDAAVCSPSAPGYDAGFSSNDASLDSGASVDTGVDGAFDTGLDTGADAGADAGIDAGADAADAGAPDATAG